MTIDNVVSDRLVVGFWAMMVAVIVFAIAQIHWASKRTLEQRRRNAIWRANQ